MTQKTAAKPNQRFDSENVIEFPQHRVVVSSPSLDLDMIGNVNKNELTSITALTSYVAHNRNVPEDVVKSYLLAQFNVPEVTELRRADYERVIRFLVDLQVDLIVN